MRFDANSREGVNSWEELHPEYAHQVLTDLHAKNLIEDVYRAIPQVLQVYKALPLPVLKADFFRYLILLAKGGVYSDIDTVALKSIPDWMPEWFQNDDVGLIVGIEADPNRADWDQWYSRRVQFCQWTILAKAGHPVLRRIVEKITMEGLQMIHNQTLTELKANDVVEFTGPGPWTDMVFSSMNTLSQEYDECISWRNFTGITEPKQVSDIIVLPITSLSPGCGHMGSKGIHDPSAFVQHKFKGKVSSDCRYKIAKVNRFMEALSPISLKRALNPLLALIRSRTGVRIHDTLCNDDSNGISILRF